MAVRKICPRRLLRTTNSVLHRATNAHLGPSSPWQPERTDQGCQIQTPLCHVGRASHTKGLGRQGKLKMRFSMASLLFLHDD